MHSADPNLFFLVAVLSIPGFPDDGTPRQIISFLDGRNPYAALVLRGFAERYQREVKRK